MEKLTEVDWEKFKKAPYPKKKEKDNSSTEKESQLFIITLKLQPASLARAYFRLVGCSDCCRLFIFFSNILKIFVILLGHTKISRIFVKEITTKKYKL